MVLFIILTSHLIRCLLAEDACRLDEKNDYKQNEGKCIGEHGPLLTYTLDDILADTYYKRTDDRTGDGAYAAEHGCDEGFKAGHCARGGNNGRIV